MKTATFEILEAFGKGLGFDALSLSEEIGLHMSCEGGDIIGFQPMDSHIVCFVQRSYLAFALNAAWPKLFKLIDQDEWQARQWRIGLREENNLVLFTFLSEVGLEAAALHGLFEEMWQLREVLP